MLVSAVLGVCVALVDFIADVFKDPMPPVTKAEQMSAKDERKRKLKVAPPRLLSR